jgi:nucleolar protein 56
VLGVFAFDEKGRHVDSIPFKGSTEAVAERYSSDKDEAELARCLAAEGHEVVTSASIEGFKHDPDNKARAILSQDMVDIAVKAGHFGSRSDAMKAIREVGLVLAAKDLGGKRPGKDIQAAKAARMLVDLNKVIERLGQGIREWFLALYPGHVEEMPGPESIEDKDDPKYHAIVTELYRKNLEVIHKVLSSETSQDVTLETVRAMANDLMQLFRERDRLEGYISDTMAEAAPTLSEVAGPNLAARLIAEAGSLHKLAMMSSTTVQLLGARKAVFRHIRHGELPPKHGFVFVHPAVSGSRLHQRGKAAKALGMLIVRAARVDAFGTGDHDKKARELKKELEEVLERIRAIPQKEKAVRPPRDRTVKVKKPGSRQRRRQNTRK